MWKKHKHIAQAERYRDPVINPSDIPRLHSENN